MVLLHEGAVGFSAGHSKAAQGVRDLTEDLGRGFSFRSRSLWADALTGFVAEMTEKEAQHLSRHPFVARVQQDYSVKATTSTDAPICKRTSNDPSNTRSLPTPFFGAWKQTITCSNPSSNCIDNWGLDRIDQRSSTLSSKYTTIGSGAGAYIFVLDTGIADHREWEDLSGNSRISSLSRSFVGVDPTDLADGTGHGHGVHVTGIAAGRTYGVAKLANIVTARVCSPSGNCRSSDFVEGLNYIAGIKGYYQSAVATFSANNSAWVGDSVIESAITGMINKKVQLVQSAGNQGQNACTHSFGGNTDTIVVGGTNSNDQRHNLSSTNASNTGSCVDIWAPAQSIVSASKKSYNEYCELTGTSMAAPHVAGAIALYLEDNPGATPAQQRAWLLNNATLGALSQIGSGSPNRLLYIP